MKIEVRPEICISMGSYAALKKGSGWLLSS